MASCPHSVTDVSQSKWRKNAHLGEAGEFLSRSTCATLISPVSLSCFPQRDFYESSRRNANGGEERVDADDTFIVAKDSDDLRSMPDRRHDPNMLTRFIC